MFWIITYLSPAKNQLASTVSNCDFIICNRLLNSWAYHQTRDVQRFLSDIRLNTIKHTLNTNHLYVQFCKKPFIEFQDTWNNLERLPGHVLRHRLNATTLSPWMGHLYLIDFMGEGKIIEGCRELSSWGSFERRRFSKAFTF